MVVSVVVLALVAVLLVFVVFQLLRQQGRILLRLDDLERAMPAARDHAHEGPQGLAPGALIPEFQLRNLDGKSVAFSDFRGRRVLLTYWSPECGFCDLAAPDLAKIQPDLKRNNTELVLLSFGGEKLNQKLAAEHGLNCSILLLEAEGAGSLAVTDEVFDSCGTPSAYLIDEEGRVARPLVAGMDEVVQLARDCIKGKLRKLPLSKSRIEREGIKAGAPAPAFTLPTLDGETVSLDQFRGRKVLLVFSDPQCGPCDELAPHLVRFHSRHANNGLAVVMVGRGDAEKNRKKAAEHGIAFPVVLQERWKLSRDYGIFATPVAFLIGKDGVVLKNVAQGPDEIMKLARESLASA